MTHSTPGPGLSSRLLADPEMAAACRSRNFTEIFRLAKARGGFHPSRIARACELTPSRVGEVIAGRREITNMNVVERIADGLRIPGHMVGLAPRAWERREAAVHPVPLAGQSATPPADSVLPGRELDDILAIAASARVTPTVLRSLQASIEDYWRRDDEHGGEALRPAVMGQLRYVLSVLRDTADPNHQRSLRGIAAELARLTGWTYFDACQYSTARSYFTEALRLAREIDDRPFIANVLSCLSLQATYEDKTREAIILARAAQDSARLDGGTPRLMAMLSMREAFGHASAHDQEAAHRAIEDAGHHFDRIDPADDDPAWVQYFDRTKLTVDAGIALGQLGDAAAAEPLIEEALRTEVSTNQRGRAFHAYWLARIQLQRGAVELACNTASEALSSATRAGSPRVAAHLQEFRHLLAPYRSTRPAAEISARIQEMRD
ncbi:hypothetical protein ACIRS1_23385 [Kitasatospora sp. NPDC101176]|uniref:hypothetical protein n=1 Tax=Kitasatospora sp. NPDC101176 TaxID=3364099 RepID=UPI00381C6D93